YTYTTINHLTHSPRTHMQRCSQLFIHTQRKAPADAEFASHKFLVRAGYVRQLAAGIYSYLFLGQRSVNKVISIVRDEMDKIGQEFLLPALHPRELWESSGRWSVMGDNMFRLKDRSGRDLCLGMTHEGAMGGSQSHEFMVYTDAGEDMVASCPKCGYAANLEKATSRLESVEDLKVSGNGSPELVHTPGMKTIEEVAKYLGVSPKQKIKTLALVGMWITEEGKRLEWPIAVFVRGDHMLN